MATEIRADLQGEFANSQDSRVLAEDGNVVLTFRADGELVRVVLPIPVATILVAQLPQMIARAERVLSRAGKPLAKSNEHA